MEIEEAIGDTLSLVNMARQAFGQSMLTELPNSKPGDSSDCLFYRAMSGLGCSGVGGSGEMSFDDERKAHYIASLWGVEVKGNRVMAPKQFGEVISAFDGKGLPHYNTTKRRDF